MNYELSQMSEVMKEALIIAWTLDHFKEASVTLNLSCFDGSTATITETLDQLDDDTENAGSSIRQTPTSKS